MGHVILDVSTDTMVISAIKNAATTVSTNCVMMGLTDAASNADLQMQNCKDASKYDAGFYFFKQGRQRF